MTVVAILGVATGMSIMNIKVKELKLQNEELTADLKFQKERANRLEYDEKHYGNWMDNWLLQFNLDFNHGYPEPNYLTPLHFVAIQGNFQIADDLLFNGADVDAKCSYSNQTPLHFASEYGYHKVVEVLLKYGSRKDLKDSLGNTPLDLAEEILSQYSPNEYGIEKYQKIVELLKTD